MPEGRRREPLPIAFALLVSLTVLVSLIPYSTDTFLPAFPTAAVALATSPSAIQLSLTAFLAGVAFGQFLFGALSDRYGRRRPLIVGCVIGAIAAIACVFAPTVGLLLLARLVQGLAASAGLVLSRTIVRDLTEGLDTVRILSLSAVGAGVLNVFAPVVGGLMLTWLGWRGPLVFIAAVSVVVAGMVVRVVPETHGREMRRSAAERHPLGGLRDHLRNRRFLGLSFVQAMSYGSLIAYVSASPFVYHVFLGFDGLTYGILFAVNAVVAVACNFVSNRLLRRVRAEVIPVAGLGISLVGVVATVATVLLDAPVWLVAPCITVSMATLALNNPPLAGLALNLISHTIGAGAAISGVLQFIVGSLVTPLVGLAGAESPWPYLLVMGIFDVGALVLFAFTVRSRTRLDADLLPGASHAGT